MSLERDSQPRSNQGNVLCLQYIRMLLTLQQRPEQLDDEDEAGGEQQQRAGQQEGAQPQVAQLGRETVQQEAALLALKGGAGRGENMVG